MNVPTPSAAAGEGEAAAVPAPVRKPSPGALLKLARERAGLAVEDLAVQIKLAKSTLEALERDDFAALSEPVYVRGYYRKIAKVLPVVEKELIEAYEQCKPAVHAPVMQRIPQLAGGVDAGVSRRARGQGLAVAATIIILTMGLLFLFSDQNKPARLADAAPGASAGDNNSSSMTPAAEAVTEPGIAPQPAPVISEASPESPSSPSGAAPQTATEPAAAEAAPAAAPAQTVVAISPAAASALPHQLVLEFSESCFVRVEDSRNRTLAIGLVRGGERQVLDGQPPYIVFLGNARNVKVFHQGKPVDFSARINAQNDTARFTVP